MKANFLPGGLSARRKAIERVLHHTAYASVHIVLIAIMAVMVVTSCRDNPAKQTSNGKDSLSRADSVHKPITDISVNRRYDDKGNLIGFDSTYTSFYSTMPGDTAEMSSVTKRLNAYSRRSQSSWFNNRVRNLFDDPFFDDDFMMRRSGDPIVNDMIHRMDSINRRFYQDHQQHHQPVNDRI